MIRRLPSRAAFTLIEMLVMVLLLAILAGMIIPKSDPGITNQLRAGAQIVASDLAYAQSLAVGNNDRYRVTFDATNNRYILEYSGSNTNLRTLPNTPFRLPSDPATQHIVDLTTLPHIGPNVQFLTAAVGTTTLTKTTTVEYGPLGQTTASDTTTIWLSAGRNAAARYITVQVNPITGLTMTGTVGATGPPSGL